MINPKLIALTILAGCSPRTDAPSDPKPESQSFVPGRLSVPATVRDNLGIEFTAAQVRQVSRSLRIPGHFELLPRARREVRLALAGRVELLVDELEEVEVGQALFRFQSSAWAEMMEEVLQAEQAVASATAEASVAEARVLEAKGQLAALGERVARVTEAGLRRADLEVELARLEASLPRLQAESSLAEVHLTGARQTHEHARDHAASAAGIEPERLASHSEPLAWIEVTASAPGVVESLGVTDGTFVEEAGLVLTTVQPKQVRFRALALQTDLPLLQGDRSARLVPPPGLGETATASLELGLTGDVPARTIVAWALPEQHKPWMRAGVAAFLDVLLEQSSTQSVAVPRTAVVRDGLQHVLFRRDPKDPDMVQRIEADLGVKGSEWFVVESGVASGDEVVTAGAFELRLATQQQGSPQKGGHFHADGTFHEEH